MCGFCEMNSEAIFVNCWLMQAVLGSLSSSVIGRPDIFNLMKQEPANTLLDAPYLLQLGQKVTVDGPYDVEGLEVEMELNNLLLSLRPIKQVCIKHYQ
jgi:exocyst complex component 4